MPEKIKFRALNMADARSLFEIYSDKEAMKYRGSKPMQTIEDARSYVRNRRLKEAETLTLREGVELTQTKELIGTVMYRFYANKKHECEIGYSIGRKFWGEGLGSVTVKAMIKSLKENIRIQKVLAWSNQDNLASIKILEKIGFKRISQREHPDSFLYQIKINH